MKMPPITDEQSRLAQIVYLTLVPASVLFVCFLVTSLLVSLRVEESVANLAEIRARLVANEVRRVVESGLRFGVQLADQNGLRRQLSEQLRGDDDVLAVTVFSDTTQPVLSESRTARSIELEQRLAKRMLDKSVANSTDDIARSFRSGGRQHVLVSIRDPIGRPGGVVAVVYADPAAAKTFAFVIKRLLKTAGLSWLAGTAACITLVTLLWGRWEQASAAVISRLGVEKAPNDGEKCMAGLKMNSVLESLETAEEELEALDQIVEGLPGGTS